MRGEGGNSVWTVLAALGGLLTGVAAILGLFIAKPESIRIFVPAQALSQVVIGEDARCAEEPSGTTAASDAAAISPVDTTVRSDVASAENGLENSPSAPGQVAQGPSHALGQGLSVTLVSLAEDGDRYIATIRFENRAGADLGVAVLYRSAFQGEMTLTDGAGGSCPFAANGEGWGTLSTERLEGAEWQLRNPDFRTVQANGRAQHTMFFNKRRCDTRITSSGNLAISGSFIVSEQSRRRAAPVFFENLSIRRMQ